jgi:hypothetical protein
VAKSSKRDSVGGFWVGSNEPVRDQVAMSHMHDFRDMLREVSVLHELRDALENRNLRT